MYAGAARWDFPSAHSVKLDTAHNLNPLRPEFFEPDGIGPGLSQNHGKLFHRWNHQSGDAKRLIKTFLRLTGIGEHHGNSPLSGLSHHGRPDFCLHDNSNGWLCFAEKRFHRSRNVIREVALGDTVGSQRHNAFPRISSRRGHMRQEKIRFRPPLQALGNQGLSGIRFTDTHRMNPDPGAPLGRRIFREPEPLTPEIPISPSPSSSDS